MGVSPDSAATAEFYPSVISAGEGGAGQCRPWCVLRIPTYQATTEDRTCASETEDQKAAALSIPELSRREVPRRFRSSFVHDAQRHCVCNHRPWRTPQPGVRTGSCDCASSGKTDPTLNVVKESKGPVMTLVDEFYKVGPGPSSSHTIGPMRITYDFYQRAAKLPADQLAQATALKVHLFGSLSATGKGHGTERAALAGLIGHEPATIDPVAVLDKMATEPDKVYPVKLGAKTINASLKDIIYDAPKGDFPHANTMAAKLMAGDKVLLEQEYYSVGGGFIEWKGYTPPKKNPPKYPYETMAQVIMRKSFLNLYV